MRTLTVVVVVLVALAGVGAASYKPAMDFWEKSNAPKWKTAEVGRGDIISVVNATGTIKPKLQIAVGSFVSGPIDPDYVIADFNQEVKKGQMLAKIQETIYLANLKRDEGNLASKAAEVERFKALHQQAINDFNRALALREEERKLKEKGFKERGFISDAEMDKFRFGRDSLKAQVDLAEAAVKQAEAQRDFSKAQLNYTNIVAPEDGTIINRKIDPGQTVAAQFQTPEMFVLAPDMRKEMYVHASVDEADIGLIYEAQRKSLPVEFTVDAYSDLFVGKILEIRLSSTTTQNVVTYPVVVSAPNPDLKLLPGMTASISFEVDRRDDVLKIPNSALRFFPQPAHVRTEDKPLLEGRQSTESDNGEVTDTGLSALDRAESRKKRNKRHVWVQERYKLRAVEVQTGLSDSRHTEVVAGELKEGDKLVVGLQPVINGWGQ